MLVNVRQPAKRASRVFAKLSTAQTFRGRLKHPATQPRRTAYEEKSARWAVNYYGAGKGSQRKRTAKEIRVRVEYDADGECIGGTSMPVRDKRPRNKFGLVVGERARYMEPD